VALRHRDFRLLWGSQLISMAGSMMQTAAILWHVSLMVPENQRGLALGMVGLVRVLPIVGLAVWRRTRSATSRTWPGRALPITTAISGALSTALILNRVPGLFGLDQLSLPPGLLQRAAGAVVIALTMVIALAGLPLRTQRR